MTNSQKVFVVGFNKSASTSLHYLFKSFGLKSFHGPEWRAGNFDLLKSYDCFSDGVPKSFKMFDESFPNSKFILNVRSLGPWLYSRLGHIERNIQKGKHRNSKGWSITEYAVQRWIIMRNQHHINVLSYFAGRPRDLLLVNYIRDENAPEKIGRFLGHVEPWPKIKKNVSKISSPPRQHQEIINGVVSSIGLEELDLKYDIIAPSIADELPSSVQVDTSDYDSSDCSTD